MRTVLRLNRVGRPRVTRSDACARALALVMVLGAGCSSLESNEGGPVGSHATRIDAQAESVRLHETFAGAFESGLPSARWIATAGPSSASVGWETQSSRSKASIPAQASTPFSVRSGDATISARLVGLAGFGALVGDEVVYGATLRGQNTTYVQRGNEFGTEDFVDFETAPPVESVDYEVTLDSGIAGLRLVGGVLEFVDGRGTPKIRMSRPRLIGANATTSVEADVNVVGCALDRDPREPWGRDPVAPGATACTVHIAWNGKGVAYPALFDPSWVATGTMVTRNRRYHGAAVMPNGRALVAGGKVNSSTGDTAEIYDPVTRTWAATGVMPTKSAYQTLTTLSTGKVANVGGADGAGVILAALHLYDPATGTWTSGAAMPNAHSQHTTNLLADGRLLVVGGYGTPTVLSSRVELYSPSTNTWAVGPSLPQTRVGHATERLSDNRVLLAGGWTGSAYVGTAQIFSPTTNAWTTTGSLGTARGGLSLNLLGSGLVLAAGGTGASGTLASSELFNVYTGLFTPTPPVLAGPRTEHRAVTLGTDHVLLIGGKNGATALGTTERYDVQANTWSSDSALAAPREGHAAVVFPSGLVLSAGAGGAETWGGPRTEGDSPSGVPIRVEWLPTTGVRSSGDLLSARITNTTGSARSVTLRVKGRGLDHRESVRTVATYSVGTTPFIATIPVGNLPVQSVGVQSLATLVADYTNNGQNGTALSLPLFHQFVAGYASATFYGQERNPVPNVDPAATYGSSAGQVLLETGAYAVQVRNAIEPTFTLVGRVWDSGTSVFRAVGDLARQIHPGGTTWGLQPMSGHESEAGKVFDSAPNAVTPETGPGYYLCVLWPGAFTDSGYGEDINTVRSVEHGPASWARALVVRRTDGKPVWSGSLDANGCAVVPLQPSTAYGISVRSSLHRTTDGATLQGSYRPGFSATREVYPALFQVGATVFGKAVISNRSLALGFGFTTAASAGLISFRSWYEDTLTRTMLVLSRAFTEPDNGVVAGTPYRAYGDLGCQGIPTSACYSSGTRTFYVGPAPDTVHDSFFKFIVGHEFGHNVQDFLFGFLGHNYDYFPAEPALCNCAAVGTLGPPTAPPSYTNANRLHCLTSKEQQAAAQQEGFGHFYASRLWNDLSGPGCTFVYYKETVRDLGGGQVAVDPFPAPRSCDAPVNWLESKCGVAAGVSGDVGIEWDWMNFFVAVNRGLDRLYIQDIGQIYKAACGGAGAPRHCAGDVPRFSNLATAAETVFGLGDARALKFRNQGNNNGINH